MSSWIGKYADARKTLDELEDFELRVGAIPGSVAWEKGKDMPTWEPLGPENARAFYARIARTNKKLHGMVRDTTLVLLLFVVAFLWSVWSYVELAKKYAAAQEIGICAPAGVSTEVLVK